KGALHRSPRRTEWSLDFFSEMKWRLRRSALPFAEPAVARGELQPPGAARAGFQRGEDRGAPAVEEAVDGGAGPEEENSDDGDVPAGLKLDKHRRVGVPE